MQARQYWQRNLCLTAILLSIWFVVTFVASYYARELDRITLFGFPLGFYMGAQGALIVYALFLPHLNEQFDNEAALNFSSGWKYEAADGSVQEVTFPTALAPNIPGGIRLTNTIPENSDVYYTLDGSIPTREKGACYQAGEPLAFSRVTVLRARAFDRADPGCRPADELPAPFPCHLVCRGRF